MPHFRSAAYEAEGPLERANRSEKGDTRAFSDVRTTESSADLGKSSGNRRSRCFRPTEPIEFSSVPNFSVFLLRRIESDGPIPEETLAAGTVSGT